MQHVDTHALALLGRSHGVAARLWASVNGSPFVVPVQLADMSGSVEIDGGSPQRRKLDANVVARIDDAEVDPLAAEIRAEYGIINPTTGDTYWTPVGTFVLTDAEEADQGVVTISGADRWQRVLDARFETPVTTSGDTLAAIRGMLEDADPRITVDTSRAPTGYTHRATLWERDRDKALVKLASSIGCTVFFDALGVAQVVPVATLSASSVWQIGPGPGGVKVQSSRKVTREATYNAVSVSGEPGPDEPPVYAVARDDNPASPTAWGGPFGKRTRFYSSNLITTKAQAQAVADAQLNRVRGFARSLDVVTVQHPGLDAGDVVAVHTGLTFETLQIRGYSLTLGPSTMTIEAAAGAEPVDEEEAE